MNDSRPFPIQGELGRPPLPESTIPWWLAEIAYEHYAAHHDQPLERIAERGGFGREELVKYIRREWPKTTG